MDFNRRLAVRINCDHGTWRPGPVNKPQNPKAMCNANTPVKVEVYRNHEIKIFNDLHAANPFTDWDCEPSILVKSGKWSQETNHGTDIRADIINRISDGQKIRHQKAIADIFGINYDELGQGSEYKIAEIDDLIAEAEFNELEQICDLMKIPCYNGTSRGYSQGDWADIFIFMTREDQERLGTPDKAIQDVLEGAAKLFGYWAWGDVYGYNIEPLKPEEVNCQDSCWGFYGDPEESGLIEEAKGMIDYCIEKARKQKFAKIKELILNKVPMHIRAQIMKNFVTL